MNQPSHKPTHMNTGMYSSATSEWETPQALFDRLNHEFGFQLDVCATANNAKCTNFFSPEQDGLSQDWSHAGTCWMNPPYGDVIGDWVKKAWQESKGAVIVCLLPARTDTHWWHTYCMKAAEIRFIRGRLKFGGGKNSAPFPSAIVVFNQNKLICAFSSFV